MEVLENAGASLHGVVDRCSAYLRDDGVARMDLPDVARGAVRRGLWALLDDHIGP